MPNPDDPTVIRIEKDCNCAAILVLKGHEYHTPGASFFLCAEHSPYPNAVVYDVDVEKIYDAFGWRYQVTPS